MWEVTNLKLIYVIPIYFDTKSNQFWDIISKCNKYRLTVLANSLALTHRFSLFFATDVLKRVRMPKGTNQKSKNQIFDHIAILKTWNLNLHTEENFLDKTLYKNVVPMKNLLLKYLIQTHGHFNIITSISLDSMHTVFHCALTWLIWDAHGSRENRWKEESSIIRSSCLQLKSN